MSKRGSSYITGGTGDLNPQWYSTTVSNITGSFATFSISTPPGIGLTTGAKPLAMEILKICYELNGGTSPATVMIGATSFAPGATTYGEQGARIYLSSKNFATTEPSLSFGDATVLDMLDYRIGVYESTAASTLAFTFPVSPIYHDLTDGAGHGILYANQQLYIGTVFSGNWGNSGQGTVRIKILYREKYINQSELLGLVLQSNQN